MERKRQPQQQPIGEREFARPSLGMANLMDRTALYKSVGQNRCRRNSMWYLGHGGYGMHHLRKHHYIGNESTRRQV